MKKMTITQKAKNVLRKYFVFIAICLACVFALGTVSANAEFIYGVKNPPGGSQAEIYKIDFSTCTATKVATSNEASVPDYSWNGNAYDVVHDRYYFTSFDQENTLYMISDFSTAPSTSVAGTLLEGVGGSGISNGTFYNGKYYYIQHHTDDLYEVTFFADGTVNTDTKKDDITDDGISFYFGDIAYGTDGILYGHVGQSDAPSTPGYSTDPKFFTYDDGSPPATLHDTSATEALQMAFGDDGVLYGHGVQIAPYPFYSIDTSNGTLTEICSSSSIGRFSDLSSGQSSAPPEEIDDCTYTVGYWKTHSEYGPAPYDDTWSQLLKGAATLFFNTEVTYYEILNTPPSKGNAYFILAHQYIAAELNELSGATMPDEVVDAFDAAAVLLGGYAGPPPPNIPEGLRESAISFADTLDQFNNGDIGPGHCDDVEIEID